MNDRHLGRNRSIPRSEWRWCGSPHHFVGGKDCRFSLATQVGDVLVSTVGDYRPSGAKEAKPIGAGTDTLFETFLFPLSGDDRDECGIATVASWTEIDAERYSTPLDAATGHMRYCEIAASGAYHQTGGA